MTASMRRLILLRHAQTNPPSNIDDHERSLSPAGVEQASEIGRWLVQEDLLPDQAIVSTARRTRMTIEIVQKQLPSLIPTIFDDKIYAAESAAILAAVHATVAENRCLLVVGHNPGVQRLALQLIGVADKNTYGRLRHEYPQGTLAVIEFDVSAWRDITDGSGSLTRIVTV